jgi:hypothetical protein
MKKPPSQLVNVLIGKSILETILVGTIAVAVYMNAFPPTFRGWGEAVPETRMIAGWAVNASEPWQRVEVHLFIDGDFLKRDTAHHSRPDIVAAGWANDEFHGYSFTTPKLPPGIHEARVYALHPSGDGGRYTLQMLGHPIRFEVHIDDSWSRR